MATNFNFTESGYVPSYNFNFGLDWVPSYFHILAGTSNNFTAIWADEDASMDNSKKMYVASASAFSVVVLNDPDSVLFNYYTTTHSGAGNEALTQEDIKDINIVI